MDTMIVGIDVSKDRLDVAFRPTGENFVFKRTAAGIEDLVTRLTAMSPALVAIEATGGFEAVVATGLALAFRWRRPQECAQFFVRRSHGCSTLQPAA